MIDPHPIMTIETGTLATTIGTAIDLTGPDPIPRVIGKGVTVGVIHEGVTPDHITDLHTAAHHTTETRAHIAINETLCIEDLDHTEVIPEITVDHPDHVHHTKATA